MRRWGGQNLCCDWRTGKHPQHSLVVLMRRLVFSRVAGCKNTNDVKRVAFNHSMRQTVGLPSDQPFVDSLQIPENRNQMIGEVRHANLPAQISC